MSSGDQTLQESDRKALLLIGVVWLITTVLWFSPGFVRPDAVGVYVYMPSTWLDRDLVFFNEWQSFGQIEQGRLLFSYVTSSGHLGVQWTCGLAVALYPSFIAGDLIRALPWLSEYPRNGISLPYSAATSFSVAIGGLLLLWLGYRISRRWFGVGESLIAVIGIWFGSPLMWYSLQHSLMPHALSALVCGITLWLSLRFRDDPGHARSMAVGLAAGLAFTIRPQNGPFVLLPFLLVEREALRRTFRESPFLGIGFVLAILPQLVVSSFILGTPWEFVHIESGELGGAFTLFQRFWIWEPFLSWYHGMFTWTPLLACGVAGIFFLRRFDRGLFRAALYSFAVQWFVNSSLDRAFWGAYAFGQRRYMNLTIFFLIGLAAFFTTIHGKASGRSLTTRRTLSMLVVAACSIWTMSLFFGMLSTIHPSEYYPVGELIQHQIAAIRESARFLTPLVRVPAPARWALVSVMAIVAGGFGLVTLLIRRASTRALTAATGAAFVLIASFFFFCGTNDASHLTRYTELIEANRGDPTVTSARARIRAILGPEYLYFIKSGRLEQAERTKRDIEALERIIAERTHSTSPPDHP